MHVASALGVGLLAVTALPFIFFATFSDPKIFDDHGTLMIPNCTRPALPMRGHASRSASSMCKWMRAPFPPSKHST
jgi:hypothetical protein